MNLTTVAHHLALLTLPPELDAVLKSGLCTSPRTLQELSRLHETQPEQTRALLAGEAEITRSAISALRLLRPSAAASVPQVSPASKLFAQANAACDRLERALSNIEASTSDAVAPPELLALRVRIADLASRWVRGSDRQTPPLIGP